MGRGKKPGKNARKRQGGGGGAGGKRSRATIAEQTLECIEKGRYMLSGKPVEISQLVKKSVEATTHYPPDHDLPHLPALDAAHTLSCEVRNESVLVTIANMAPQWSDCCVLNFASAKNPGGGFLGGAQAQEEALARSSALYPTLIKDLSMYKYHKQKLYGHTLCLYSHYMIFSPDVVVFKNDAGACIPHVTCSFITSPAVNAGVVRQRQNRGDPEEIIRETMRERMRRILHICAVRGHTSLILGAFGCGVFQNSPLVVAQLWHELLYSSEFAGRFANVVFSIFGGGRRGDDNLDAFKNVFEQQ